MATVTMLVSFEKDTIATIESWWLDIQRNKYPYKALSDDSIAIYRDNNIITKHKLIFFGKDSIKITKIIYNPSLHEYHDVNFIKK